jgi:two-component system, OmpR family, phosphate regulon response regulator PhoB
MSKKVLIVDDDPDVRLFNSTVVEENGYTPVEASNGEEALQIIQKEAPALVLLDVLMPKQSGIRFYRVLKTEKAFMGIPVIILSGVAKRTFLRSQKALTEFGDKPVPEPESYLEKPVEADELAKEIKRFIG